MCNRLYFLTILCAFVTLVKSGPDSKESLNEIIDSTLSEKFDSIFTLDDKKGSGLAMLKYSIEHTTIDPDYLTKVFLEAFEVSSKEELETKTYNVNGAVDMMNKVIKHFQESPNDAGRPGSKAKEEL